MVLPLTAALSKLLSCKPENLAEYLNNPEAVNKVNAYQSGKKLKTTYQGRDYKTKVVKFGTFSLKAAAETYAFEGFLDVKVHQYFYIKHRIRLLYPQLKCIVEYHNKGHCKYYRNRLPGLLELSQWVTVNTLQTMKRARQSEKLGEFPEIEFAVNTMGVTVYCPRHLQTPWFVPWDQPGRCSSCRSGTVELDYIIQPEGVTIFSNRLKTDGENFVPFDAIVDFADRAKFRIRARNKVFTLPLRHPEVHAAGPSLEEAVKEQKEMTQIP